jgi:hypothetical protein
MIAVIGTAGCVTGTVLVDCSPSRKAQGEGLSTTHKETPKYEISGLQRTSNAENITISG